VYYACSYHRLRGDKVCSNSLTMPMASADDGVIQVLREDILNPAALSLAIEMAADRFAARPGDVAQERAAIEAERAWSIWTASPRRLAWTRSG
jgi:hypothetical protein